MATENARTPDVITIAVSRVDGGLTVLRVVTTEYRPSTDAEKADGLGNRTINWTIDPTDAYINGIIAQHNWQGLQAPTTWRRVPNDFVDDATKRVFRNAWMDDGSNKPGTNMVKARSIHMDRIRIVRDAELERLDREYLHADEQGDLLLKQSIAAQKQTLRDIPVTFDLTIATTPEALDALWPAELPVRSTVTALGSRK